MSAVRKLVPTNYRSIDRLYPFFLSVQSDTTPDAFSFTTQSGVTRSATITSESVTPVGYTDDTTITISGGTYSINGGGYTGSDGTLSPGDALTLRHTSSASYLTAVTTTVTVGGVDATFTSVTQGDPATAADIWRYFSFNWWE